MLTDASCRTIKIFLPFMYKFIYFCLNTKQVFKITFVTFCAYVRPASMLSEM